MWWSPLVLVALAWGAAGEGWWSSAVYYRVVVDSFKDGDGDGLGDLQGTIKQASYIRALGADALLLSPINSRSTDCSSPGTVDFTVIDQRYGDLSQFTALMDKAKKLELKLLISLDIRTVSTASDWFKSSVERTTGFEDRLVWQQGTSDSPPPPEPGIESWTWEESRNAFWASKSNQAILNPCSETLMADLASAMCAWVRRGIYGVLLSLDFPKDMRCSEQLLRKLTSESTRCARSVNLDAPLILIESALPLQEAAKYYEVGVGASSILSGALATATKASAAELAVAFYAALLSAPQDGLPTWVTSVTNESRISTRLGNDMVDAINLLALILPGAVIIQQGDELGAADTILEWANEAETCWPMDHVASNAPFPWDDSQSAGFSSGTPWLPLAPNYRYANAKTEFSNNYSHVGVVRVAAALRKSPAIGPHAEIKRLGGAVSVLRWGGTGSLLVIANIGRDLTEVQLSMIPGLPAEMVVAASSAGSGLSIGGHVAIDKALKLTSGEAVLLAGPPRHCGGPGPVDKIANKLNEGWQKVNKYFSNI